MAMKVETVDILVEQAHLEPQVAVAVAQAMDVAMEENMRDRQLVTVTALAEAKGELLTRIERQGSELRAEIHAVKSDMLRHMYSAIATQMALLLGIAYFFSLHVK
jgi:proline dehydrogenase